MRTNPYDKPYTVLKAPVLIAFMCEYKNIHEPCHIYLWFRIRAIKKEVYLVSSYEL